MDSEKWLSSDNNSLFPEELSHLPLVTGAEEAYVLHAIQQKKLSADNFYSQACTSLLKTLTGCPEVILTTSCTDALEMAALLINTQPGDEIIMASFNFVSAPNAFVLRGARVIFVDILPDTLNVDPFCIQQAITPKTKAIVVMHYAGVPCRMDEILQIAEKFGLFVIEDAAHAMGSYYKGQHLGTFGHLGAISFHESKNIQCGEGGALLVNDSRFLQRAHILKDKGTNRLEFFKGRVQKYTWVDIGSSYGLGELNAAFLYAQLQSLEEVTKTRLAKWHQYDRLFKNTPGIEIPESAGNGHIFYVKMENKQVRETMIGRLKKHRITATSHYEPLHLSKAGKLFSEFHGEDRYTTTQAGRLLRLPLYFDLSEEAILYIFDRFMACYDM